MSHPEVNHARKVVLREESLAWQNYQANSVACYITPTHG
jgi:hypothetical protein